MIVEIEGVGHLGVCVGRAEDGRAVLVRHALPGERVRVEVTETRTSYLRGDAVEILRASPSRVLPPCPVAGPGACGGCDWQHADLAAQRELKATVVADALLRAGVEGPIVVEPVPGDRDGLDWRTRVRLAVDSSGAAGFHRHRSSEVQPIADCPIADPALGLPGLLTGRFTPGREIEAPAGAAHQLAAGRTWRVPGGGFWQVHPGAANTFVDALSAMLAPQPGERLLDLYSGVGLFAGALSARHGLGPATAVESDRAATVAARENLADLVVSCLCAPVERWVTGPGISTAAPDLIVLDPPRKGAGRPVVEALAASRARAIGYVACEPAALARDLAIFAEHGWHATSVRAFDAFPMTAHVEVIATIVPAARTP